MYLHVKKIHLYNQNALIGKTLVSDIFECIKYHTQWSVIISQQLYWYVGNSLKPKENYYYDYIDLKCSVSFVDWDEPQLRVKWTLVRGF